ncbi:hypothetical protein V8F06_010400 [Rhypophila decipiens]
MLFWMPARASGRAGCLTVTGGLGLVALSCSGLVNAITLSDWSPLDQSAAPSSGPGGSSVSPARGEFACLDMLASASS